MFAYADTTGTQLMALEPVANHSAIRKALCKHGQVLDVRYGRTQAARPADTHRQVAANFTNEAGDVYLPESRVSPDDTCLLTGDTLLAQSVAPVDSEQVTLCDTTLALLLAHHGRRGVVHCEKLGRVAWGAAIVGVQFAPIDTSALAAIALVQDSVQLFYGIEGRDNGPRDDIWRVGDGGRFSTEAFSWLFAAQLPHGYALAFAWAGEEGENDELLVADSTHFGRKVIENYRYWVPN